MRHRTIQELHQDYDERLALEMVFLKAARLVPMLVVDLVVQ